MYIAYSHETLVEYWHKLALSMVLLSKLGLTSLILKPHDPSCVFHRHLNPLQTARRIKVEIPEGNSTYPNTYHIGDWVSKVFYQSPSKNLGYLPYWINLL